jgi:polyhydroxyalkanoate synthase
MADNAEATETAEATPTANANPSDGYSSAPLYLDPEMALEIQRQYLEQSQKLIRESLKADAPISDRRFGDAAWVQNPLSHMMANMYLLNAKTMQQMADAIQADPKTKARIAFAVDQFIDAYSPSNFLATNPVALEKAIATEGKSIAQGVNNLLQDLSQGSISQTDATAFDVGQNIATTEGAVVYENPYFQLIEYKPLTETVFSRPFLFVPPCINKYYILDLQPTNSLIRYTVSQGHRTFVLSWRNADPELAHASWSDYVEHAVMQAINKVCAVTGSPDVNALGFCVGGTLLANALAVFAARGEKPVASATFLTTLLDFTDTGILDIFIDETTVELREKQFEQGGLMLGKDLAATFNSLRSRDLIWNYVQKNYLMGESPPAFDLLYWNSDFTNLPGPMYAWYLRNTYLENNLVQPGRCSVAGQAVDLRRIDIPCYLYASREDHIVPPQSAFASIAHLGSKDIRFVLGASGHIAGVINPPSSNKRCYWTGSLKPQGSAKSKVKTPDYESWLAQSTEVAGSWWPDWTQWLAQQAGKPIAAPKSYGNKTYKALEAAPGRYVQTKAYTPKPNT